MWWELQVGGKLFQGILGNESFILIDTIPDEVSLKNNIRFEKVD